MSSAEVPSDDEKQPGLFKLTDEQQAAVDPSRQVWLRASAGTGKTQVLTARVIRLLLTPGVRPEHILCITFTKAGAAEMAERINTLLARWVQEDDVRLFHDLEAIGAPSGPEARETARALFAAVLDAPGGGLQILTIHSLAQSLLGSFPEEAGLIPGFNPVEGREQDELYNEALGTMVLEAEESGNDFLIGHLQSLSLALGEEGALKFLKKCAGQPGAMEMVTDDKGALILARRITGVAFEGSLQAMLQGALRDDVIDRPAIEALAARNLDWNAKPGSRGAKRAQAIHEWLAMEVSQRAENFDMLHKCWAKGDGDPMVSSKGFTPMDEGYAELALTLYHWTKGLHEQIMLAEYADRLAPALLAGKAFADQYMRAKKIRALVDFDDMIRMASGLLSKPGMGEWIRFKLDSRIDHILVDESQDTNRRQWDIIDALSSDFFSGLGAKDEERLRTIFSVGDEKQAIFGFQGTDPAEYNTARLSFEERIAQSDQTLDKPALNRSFRSNKPILNLVNKTFEHAAYEMGDIGGFRDHESKLPDIGSVELILPVTSDLGAADDDENWVDDAKRILASRIARRVEQLTREAPYLFSTGKRLRPGDIMILLRSRGEVAPALVAQLHACGVAVAGIDRLKMAEPLVVQDMLAAIRFVLQPADDFSLACLLVSPLIGWSQEQLLANGYREAGVDLWDHLRRQTDSVPEVADAVTLLKEMLGSADFTTAYAFLEQILSGDMAGRRKFTARLGMDALIPMEEMLNLALQFEQQGGGTLQAFLRWFESGETEIKREMLPNSDEVRVMTVHGAKGLQAPVVILADVTSDPTKKPDQSNALAIDGGELPLLNIRKQERFGRLEEAAEKQEKREAEEHLRLLYVAMTRAQEHLIMAGALSDRDKDKGPPESSWYHWLEKGMTALDCDWQENELFGRAMLYQGAETAEQKDALADDAELEVGEANASLPDWLTSPAPRESRPPKPLVPSRLDDDDYGDPPAQDGVSVAAEKGRLLHMIFERITGDNIERDLQAAAAWLSRQKLPKGLTREELIDAAKAVLQDPALAEWFGPDSYAEVPLSAVVGEMVVSGRVDRLLITKDKVSILDFKTGRHIPRDEADVSAAFLSQMAHYSAALEVIFPDRNIEATLLYTAGPQQITLSDAALCPFRPKA